MLSAFTIFIVNPLLAAVPAIIFAGLWLWSRSRTTLAAAVLWALYTAWEWSIHAGYACDGECDIRVDLLLIAPVLLIVSVAAIARSIWRRRGRS